jgi:hypothetical protein
MTTIVGVDGVFPVEPVLRPPKGVSVLLRDLEFILAFLLLVPYTQDALKPQESNSNNELLRRRQTNSRFLQAHN